MISKNKIIELKTKECLEFINLTKEIDEFVSQSGIKNGLVNIQSMHTTGAIIVNEDEPLLISDLKKALERLFPQGEDYAHDNFEIRTVNVCMGECANGHAHCKAITLPTTTTLNIVDGKIQLGMWQQIFFLELDRSRDRQVQLQILGE